MTWACNGTGRKYMNTQSTRMNKQTNENKTAMTLPKTNTMEVASADSSGGGGGSSSVGGVRVVCALFEDEADNVNNVLVTSVDERILRVGQSTVPKTFIFDQVVTDNTTNNTSNTSNKSDGSFKLSLSSKLSNAAKDIMNASNGSNGNVCVVSLAGTFQ